MRSNTRTLAVLGLGLLAMSTSASAQTNFPETEPNGSKAEANAVVCMLSGDTISGLSTGASVTAGSTTDATADTFRVKTCALPIGIYRHQLLITTAGAAGHVGSIRGLTQVGGVPTAGTDAAVQASLTTTIPPRMNAWYGFGREAEIYYRVTGTASTTTGYVSTLSSASVSAIPIGTYASGSITITTCGQGHTTDTELWLYDANLAAIAGHGNDDASPACAGHTLGSTLTRTLAPGRYYLAISDYNFANNLGSTGPGEGFMTGFALDFPDVAADASATDPLNIAFGVTDTAGTTPIAATKTGDFAIAWFKFDVADAGAGVPFCEPGVAGVMACACGNPNGTGLGCQNTGSGGGNLSSAGVASLTSDMTDPGSVTLTGTTMLSGSTCIFLQGGTVLAGGTTFGAGIRCAEAPLKRLYTKSLVALGGMKTAPEAGDLSISNRSAATGDTLFSGAIRYYQVYYRDPGLPNPGGACPAIATFNITRGQVITWTL